MDREAVKERIKVYVEVLKLLWILAIALGGGEVGLLVNLDSGIKVILFVVGFFILILTIMGIVYILLAVRNELERLEKGG